MKLSQVKRAIDSATPILETAFSILTKNATVSEQEKPIIFNSLKKALKLITDAGITIQAFLLNDRLLRPSDLFPGDNVLINSLRDILDTLNVLKPVINQLIPATPENCIYIKMPPVRDLKDLSDISGRIFDIFSQLIFDPEINGKLDLDDFENGSLYTRIIVGTHTGVLLLASLAWSSAVVLKKYQETVYMTTVIKERSAQIEEHQKIADLYLDLAKKAIIETEARHIANEHFKEEDHERFERIKYVLSELAKEMDKGARIIPSLEAPEDIKQLFPDPQNLLSVDSKTKLLTDKKKEEGAAEK